MSTPGPTDRGGYGGPQSSMALLVDLLRDSGDPGYAEAAARRAERGAPPGRRGPVDIAIALLALALVGLLLTAAALQTRRAAPVVEAGRRELVDRIQERTERLNAGEAANRSLAAEVADLQEQALRASDEGRALAAREAELAVAAQYTPVTGPGTVVTLEDSPDARRPDDPSQPDLGRILDRDIQLTVNGLWQAGAEAIAVNGQRLSARTAIRAAGGAVLVDYRPLVPPYRVEAVGPPSMEKAFGDGPAGTALASLRDTYGIRFDVTGESSISLPAATSTLPVLATPIGGTP